MCSLTRQARPKNVEEIKNKKEDSKSRAMSTLKDF